MGNCIISQSGGPTSVINASLSGVIEKNLELKHYDNVYGGINGIEGILKGTIVNLSKLSLDEVLELRHTPAAALGSCRYKLGNPDVSCNEYAKLFETFKELDIETFFYIGGNDSMDTVYKLNEYAKANGHTTKFVGIPKTIDNDLCVTDHTPGFGSAAKMIATTILETYLDSVVYRQNGVFIIETMGRDTGWLAASAALAKLNSKPVVDLIYLPEVDFSIDKFLEDVKEKLSTQNNVYVVISEGLRNEKREFITKSSTPHGLDKFGHTQLGGVANYLKSILLESGITNKVRAVELNTTQRCGMHIASLTDIEEAVGAGKFAYKMSMEGITGHIAGIRRKSNEPYETEFFPVDASKAANNVKYFPAELINDSKNFVKEEALEYLSPLILGEPELKYENGLPKYFRLDYDKYKIK